MPRVLIVDDSGDIARLYCKAVDLEPHLKCVATLPCADKLEEAVQRHRPDVVLLDLTMPGRDPLDATRAVSAAYPWCRIILFSGRTDPSLAQAALEAGAWGVLSKIALPRDVFEAIRRVKSGEMVFG